ncbi:hypothetical protein CS542_07710 [Pedobacter sp. IW39]|nr:hypothetical protein CS542_07710 [Pedobacter sp. IW39]
MGEEYSFFLTAKPDVKASEDVRWSYIRPLKDGDGAVQKKNGIEVYYISKFSFQDGSPNLSSPILFRLSEMYLKSRGRSQNGQYRSGWMM